MENNKLEIPEAAVQLVATMYSESEDTGSLDTARAALEAAAPFLRAQGVEYAIKRLEELVGVQKDEAQWRLILDWLTTTAWTLQYGTEKGEGK